MNIINVKSADAINGPGIRASIWVAGCVNKCKGCWSPQTWNPNQGDNYESLIDKIKEVSSNKYIDGVAILGGDPFYWVIEKDEISLRNMLITIKENLYKGDVWLWTGYTFEYLMKNPLAKECLKYIDVLIDSKFDLSKRNLDLKFRGSLNQRVIDVKKTLEKGKIILFE